MNENLHGWRGPNSIPRLSGFYSDLQMNGNKNALNGTDPADLKYTTIHLAGTGIAALLIGLGAGFYFFGRKK